MANASQRRAGWAVAALLALPAPAPAITLEGLEQAAFGVEGYYQSRDRCYYHEALEPMFQRLDDHYYQQLGDFWLTVREKVAPSVKMSVNMGRMLSPESAIPDDQALCRNVSLHISFILMGGMMIFGPTPEVMKEIDRLGAGRGQVR